MLAPMEWIAALLLVLLVWAVVIYNLLVRDLHRVRAAWSDIEVQLKRRHDLIPKLVDAVRQYAAYEQATLSTLTELRSRAAGAARAGLRAPLEQALGAEIHKLIALAEAYPDLKASDSFLDLQRNLTEVENDIQMARRYYNGAVRNYNVRIDSFPDLLIARLFRFRPAEFFELEDAA
ncbi:MAG: LemA family protein [Gammaproteobacteria bacterium]|nr:MAG: LemA family protein [Gammaproteobacteria bacterium]